MEKITKFALEYNRVTALVLIFGVLIGISALLTMPRQEDPTVTIRAAQINTYFPGMSTELMENLIAAPIERKLREIPEIKDLNTTVRTGHVLIQPNLYDRYFDLEPIWQKVRNKMEEIQTELPSGTQGPIVNDDFGRVAAATLAIYSNDFDLNDIYKVAKIIQDQLYGIDGLSKIELYGKQDEQIYLEFNIAQLSNYGLKPQNIISSLQNQNVVSSSGSIEANGRKLQLEVSGRFKTIDEIENLTITNPNTNLPLYLKDIVSVKRNLINPPVRPVFFKNQPAIILSFSMVEQFIIEVFGEELKQKIHNIAKDFPAGINIEFATYQPELVKKSVQNTITNLVQTVCVVLFVVICFLGIKNGLIVGAIIPLTIMFTLIVMELLAIDLQTMSIAAIIIALGLLVDDGIIITEDIATRSDSGEPIKKAAFKTVSSLAVPSLISSLTTMLAFLPLALSENLTGEYLSSLSYVIVIALLISWFLSIYAVPVLCVKFIKRQNKEQQLKSIDKITEILKTNYQFVLNYILKCPRIFMMIMISLLIISIYCLKFLPKQMLPYSDRNQFLIYLDLPAGTNIIETEATALKLGKWLNDKEINPEIVSNVTYIGFGGPRFVLSLSPPDAKSNVAFIIVNTKTSKNIKDLIKKTNHFMNDYLPNASGRAKQMWMGGQEIGLIEYKVKGKDDKVLYEIANEIEKIIKAYPGAVGIVNDWQNPIATFEIIIDQNRAQRANVSSKSVSESLNSYLDGTKISNFYDEDIAIPIIIRGDMQRNRIGELRTVPVFTNDGKTIPLNQIADFKGDINNSVIKRINQERTITISAKHDFLQASGFHKELLKEINNIHLPEGYRIDFGGEVEGSSKANAALFANLPFAIICMAILIVLQFNSFRRTAIIMLTIPLVIIGTVFGLWIGNAFLSFTAILGMFSLAGIVINNGIILIDKADAELKEGKTSIESIQIAANARLRPILITTLTTIIGLIPMALFGGDMWYPMAIVIMFGLFIGTILTLGVVPVLYVLLVGNNTNLNHKNKTDEFIMINSAQKASPSFKNITNSISTDDIDAEHEFSEILQQYGLKKKQTNLKNLIRKGLAKFKYVPKHKLDHTENNLETKLANHRPRRLNNEEDDTK